MNGIRINKGCFLLLVSLLMVVLSCKKGEEDPGFSLRSRKNRLVGEWNVQDLSRRLVSDDGSYKLTVEEGRVYETSGGGSYSGNGVFTFEFNKDNTYSWDFDYSLTLGYGYKVYITEREAGSWQFSGGYEEYKNHEMLLMIPDNKSFNEFVPGYFTNGYSQNVVNVDTYIHQIKELSYKKVQLFLKQKVVNHNIDLPDLDLEMEITLVRVEK